MRRILYLLVLLGVAGAVAWGFLPKPLPVDLARVARGPLVVTVDVEGRTRIRERYVLAAPVAGRMDRVLVDPGDRVAAGRTVLLRIDPETSPLLDERTRRTAETRLAAAGAAREQAAATLERAQAAETLAATNVERVRALHASRTVSRQDVDESETAARLAASERRAAEFALQVAQHEEEMARVTVECCRFDVAGGDPATRIAVPAPVDGVVLRVFQESARVVAAGERILEIGDPRDLDVEADVLSSDAVRIRPGARAVLERWGGGAALGAGVRRVEPAAFTKVSALGVEEQRVWVLLDLAAPPEAWAALGDGYRVEARIVVWEAQDVAKVPVGALFRDGPAWAVYLASGGRAVVRRVEVGAMDGVEAEVLGGLVPGDEVVLHPSDRLAPGAAIRPR